MDRTRRFLTILSLACALAAFGAVEPKAVQTLELQPGWNLVTLEGTPLQPERLLALKPLLFDETSRSYIQYSTATALARGSAVWIHCVKAQSVEVPLAVTTVTTPEPTPGAAEWSQVGAASASPPWLSQVTLPFFRWEPQRGFVPANEAVKGQGYWVKKQ